MKITILATGQSVDYYTFSEETITAHLFDMSESYDLSSLEHGDQVSFEPISGIPAIRAAERLSDGTLKVTLCQQVGPGHWKESEEFDSEDYNPDTVYVQYLNKPHSGRAWAKTKNGKQYVEDDNA